MSGVAGEIEHLLVIAEADLGRSLKPSGVSSYWVGRAVRFALEEPARESALLYRKFLLAWNWYEVPDNYNQYFFGRSSFLFRGFLPAFHWIAPFAMIGMIASLRDWRRTGFLHIYVLSYLGSLIALYVTSRYRLPLAIGLIPFAANGIVVTIRVARTWQWRNALLVALVLLSMFWLTRRSLFDHYQNSQDCQDC